MHLTIKAHANHLFAALAVACTMASPLRADLFYTQTADNVEWPSVPAGFISNQSSAVVGGSPAIYRGFYDAFTFTVTGTPFANINSVTIQFYFSGFFDDSIGIDLNGDGTIDFAASQWDFYALSPAPPVSYEPWTNLNTVSNIGLSLTIGTSSTSAAAYYYGQALTSVTLNNLAGFKLSDLGLTTFNGSGAATTTSSLRIGFLNVDQSGGGSPTITSSNFGSLSPQAAVPEPGTWAATVLLAGGAALMRWRSRARVS